ncbi:FecR family protein [Dyadobacter bucti]|uniref:FecR family protein n=1 Tax=Dyadobacter bucti TaxID=2572203 RepID=UPI00110894C2|nr:FecR domain-containing protein [Dyadobacter bucti]
MSNIEQRLGQLLEQYRNDDLSSEEYEEFLRLIGEPGHENVLNQAAEKDWQESGEILRMIKAQHQPLRNSARLIRLSWMIAASVALVTSAYFFWPRIKPAPETIAYQTLYGETKKLVLPDSSTVLLNANSRLEWDSDWEKHGKRTAKLEGEAFFEVKKTRGMGFVVRSGNVNVEVLGTVFNVRNRRGLTDVYLESGKVNLEIDETGNRSVTMKPGNSVHYNTTRKVLVVEQTSTMSQSASWVEGMLEFQNKPLGDILNHFEELYGKKFKIENKSLLTRRMDLSLPYSNWDLIRKALEISLHVEFTETKDSIVVK